MAIFPIFNTAYCKSFEVEKFCVFANQLVPRNSSSEIACAIGFDHARLPSNCESFQVNESLVLQPQSFSISSDLQYTVHTLQLATYIGIWYDKQYCKHFIVP